MSFTADNPGRPWESRARQNRWAHCEWWQGNRVYRLAITDESERTMITASVTVEEMAALVQYHRLTQAARIAQARFGRGS